MFDIKTLFDLGMLSPVFAGIQVDCNVVRRNEGEASLCDHNCTTLVGGYNCPAAFTLNRGAKKPFASIERLLSWITDAATALKQRRDQFLEDDGGYFKDFSIPVFLRGLIKEALRSGKVEVNLFGGNPEMHDEIAVLIRELRAQEFVVNLTTTGRRFITDGTFQEIMLKHPPNLLALSADDFEYSKVSELVSLDIFSLKAEWKKIPALSGQTQKFLEGIYTARLYGRHPEVQVLFNMVVHSGNLAEIDRLSEALTKNFPGVLVNPYPAQSSFIGGENTFSVVEIVAFEAMIDRMIKLTKIGKSAFVKRLHYWLVLKAICELWRSNPEIAAQMLAGYSTWQCYRRPIMPYLQIGKRAEGTAVLARTNESIGVPGGKLGCFWNSETVSASIPINGVEDVSEYLNGGMVKLAEQSLHPCPGCLMPRLMFNMITTECGLDPTLIESYLKLRKEHAGF